MEVKPTVNVHIDQLELEGVAAADVPAFVQALRERLQQRFAASPPGAAAHATLTPPPVPAPTGPANFGRDVADAVATEVSR
jgi:hypothetical protein